MKRRSLAVLLCLALCLAVLPAAAEAAFTDISDPETALAAATLQGLGIVSGTASDTFSPSQTLTRAQVCTMAVNAAGLASQVSAYTRKTMFTDVAASSWYNGYVNLAYAEGFVSGNGDGTFSPDQAVTYGELATILLRMLGYTSEEVGSVWPLDYTGFCDELGLSDGLGLGAYDTVTRGEAAILFYRTLKTEVNGSEQKYFETIEGVASTADAILLDTDASYGGDSALLMVYEPGGDGITYYTQKNAQSAALEGSLGTLLFNSSGQAVGFVPEDAGWTDLTVESATASAVESTSGVSYRISSGAVVIDGGDTYDYSASGYLRLNEGSGRTVRLFYDDDGTVAYLYLSGGTASTSEAAVASAGSANSLARALGLSGTDYAITKNGAAADTSDVAAYDVGYYDAATDTLRVSDYRITGYLEEASPSTAAAETVTVAGCTLDVLECAWETLGAYAPGERVTLLLTDDCKVAAACSPSELSAEMIGVLAEDGQSVVLSGSGLSLTADTISADASDRGRLVKVSVSSVSRLRCSDISDASAGRLDLVEGTLGDLALAPACDIYEQADSRSYVCDLEGNRASSSSSFDVITWTDTISSSDVAYYHTNSAGQVDILLLEDVTGNCYEYGELTTYTGSDGISLGDGTMSAYNRAGVLTNGDGRTDKFLYSGTVSSGSFAAVSLGQYDEQYERAGSASKLQRHSGVTSGDFYQLDGTWYAEVDGAEYRISDQLQVYLEDADRWLTGEDALLSVLADGMTLTLYSDRTAETGGQIRVLTAE